MNFGGTMPSQYDGRWYKTELLSPEERVQRRIGRREGYDVSGRTWWQENRVSMYVSGVDRPCGGTCPDCRLDREDDELAAALKTDGRESTT